MKSFSFSIIGGDMRQVSLCELLANDGHSVKSFGIDKNQTDSHISLKDCIKGSDCVVLPLPMTDTEGHITAPFYNGKITYQDIIEHIEKNTIVAGGKISKSYIDDAKTKQIKLIDYFEREELCVLNSIATAEGALQIAMEETAKTIHGSNCLVIGYGRIGKILSSYLKALGANVIVSARKFSDFAWIKTFGYKSVDTRDNKTDYNDIDIIFNTVPFMVLDKKKLQAVKQDTLIIDLASKPGGVDFEYAKDKNLKVIWALSLPGKVAPITSAEVIKGTIYNIMKEEKNLEY